MSKESKIGIVVLLIVALFFWGYNFLKGQNVLESNSRIFYIEYNNIQGLKKAIYGIWVWQLVLCVPLYYFSTPIAELFSQNPEVVQWLSFYLHWLPFGFAPLSTLILVAQAFIAYNRPSYAVGINACRLLGFTLPLTWLGVQFFGIAGAFMAPLGANIIMGCGSYLVLKRHFRQNSWRPNA